MTMSPVPGAGPLPPLGAGGAPVVPPASDEPGEVDALREDIEQTRTELGQTVEALAAKADVKARVQEAADDARAKVRERVHDATVRAEAALPDGAVRTVRRYRGTLLARAGAAVLVLVLVRWRRGRTA